MSMNVRAEGRPAPPASAYGFLACSLLDRAAIATRGHRKSSALSANSTGSSAVMLSFSHEKDLAQPRFRIYSRYMSEKYPGSGRG